MNDVTRAWRSRRTLILVVLIALLLCALGALQYRWVGELNAFEHRRMRNSLLAASERFEDDFEGEFERLRSAFRLRRSGDFPDGIVEGYREWARSAPAPAIVDAAYWVSGEDGELSISRFDLDEARFSESSWPTPLLDMREEFSRELERRGRFRRDSYIATVGGELLALVVAQRDLAVPSRSIVLLRRRVLVEEFIPNRLQAYVAGGSQLDYDVWIADEVDAGRIVYRSEAAVGDGDSPDVRIDLRIPNRIDARDGRKHLWSVLLRHRAGSLEAAVGEIRRRNLIVSLGILALLGTSVVVLVAATRRAQRLADQQMAFVAGVSHELRTPISGISSLSQNLADGVVRDPTHAREYGEAIHRESRRLADMIETVLGFSATRSRNRRYERRPLRLPDVIDDVLESLSPERARRFHIERRADEDLPPVLGDVRAVRSVIHNLISNAMKFSEEGGRIGVSARLAETGGRRAVQVIVEDEGHGIPAAELPLVFEPFFRGQRPRAEQVDGSGLGLSLVKEVVEAHGGRVTVESRVGEGSTFVLHWPVADGSEGVDGESTSRLP